MRNVSSRLVSLGRRIFGNSARLGVMAEDGVVLSGCQIIGDVTVGMQSYANLSVIRNADIGRYCSIGRRCSIGAAKHNVSALSTHPLFDRTFENVQRTKVGNDVWIGDGAVIISGLTIGDGAIIGANAVVTKNIPPYAIVGGVPANLIRMRFDEQTILRLTSSEWWNYEVNFISNIDENLQALGRKIPPHHVRR